MVRMNRKFGWGWLSVMLMTLLLVSGCNKNERDSPKLPKVTSKQAATDGLG